jgi:hypothetical protein
LSYLHTQNVGKLLHICFVYIYRSNAVTPTTVLGFPVKHIDNISKTRKTKHVLNVFNLDEGKDYSDDFVWVRSLKYIKRPQEFKVVIILVQTSNCILMIPLNNEIHMKPSVEGWLHMYLKIELTWI